MHFRQFTDTGNYQRHGLECWMVEFTDKERADLTWPYKHDLVRNIGKTTGRRAFEEDLPLKRVVHGLWDIGHRGISLPMYRALDEGYTEAAREWSLPDRVLRNAEQREWHRINGKNIDMVTARAESNPTEFLNRVLAQSILLEFNETQHYQTYPKETVQSIEATIDLVGTDNLLEALVARPSKFA